MPACRCVLLRQAHRFWWSKQNALRTKGTAGPPAIIREHTDARTSACRLKQVFVMYRASWSLFPSGGYIWHYGLMAVHRVCDVIVVAMKDGSFRNEDSTTIQSDLLCTASEGVLHWIRSIGWLFPGKVNAQTGPSRDCVPYIGQDSHPIFFFVVLKLVFVLRVRWLGHRVGTEYLKCTTTSSTVSDLLRLSRANSKAAWLRRRF